MNVPLSYKLNGKIPLLNDYGCAFFEKGVLLWGLIRFGESYRSCSQDSWFNLTLCSGWKDALPPFSSPCIRLWLYDSTIPEEAVALGRLNMEEPQATGVFPKSRVPARGRKGQFCDQRSAHWMESTLNREERVAGLASPTSRF